MALGEGITKICKILKSHDGFLRYLQDRTANIAHLAAIFCPILVCPQKAQVDKKNDAKWWKYFLLEYKE
jgi:hypothetical protein